MDTNEELVPATTNPIGCTLNCGKLVTYQSRDTAEVEDIV